MHMYVARSKIVQRTAPPKLEDGSSIDPNSHCPVLIHLSDNKVKFVRDCPALCLPELWDLKKKKRNTRNLALVEHCQVGALAVPFQPVCFTAKGTSRCVLLTCTRASSPSSEQDSVGVVPRNPESVTSSTVSPMDRTSVALTKDTMM